MRTNLVLAAVIAFAAPSAAHAAGAGGRSISDFFLGHLVADGTYQDLRAGSNRHVHVDIHGSQRGQAFVVSTNTSFSDGERRNKTWTFKPAGPGRYIGYRPDLIGTASAQVNGDAIDLTYRAHVPAKDGKAYDLNFVERYVVRGPGELDNTMRITFLFVQVGEAHLAIHKAGG